ncbi:MAG: hypothetical protein IJE08_07905 [Clostridia bacterium]|nr:hypothetical protein [Clostridia bacterium]
MGGKAGGAVQNQPVNGALVKERRKRADAVEITFFLAEIDQVTEGISGGEGSEGDNLIPTVFVGGRATFL